MFYRLVLLLKLVAVLGYGGGLAAAFLASSHADRKRAVHAVASPSLVAIWFTGYVLVSELGIGLMELWVLGALVLSLVSLLALVHSVTRDRRTLGAFVAAAVPLVVVLGLMVFRPTWARMRGS